MFNKLFKKNKKQKLQDRIKNLETMITEISTDMASLKQDLETSKNQHASDIKKIYDEMYDLSFEGADPDSKKNKMKEAIDAIMEY